MKLEEKIIKTGLYAGLALWLSWSALCLYYIIIPHASLNNEFIQWLVISIPAFILPIAIARVAVAIVVFLRNGKKKR